MSLVLPRSTTLVYSHLTAIEHPNLALAAHAPRGLELDVCCRLHLIVVAGTGNGESALLRDQHVCLLAAALPAGAKWVA
eukprot:6191247-Pleurochrysis_carterae.AAC.1